MTTMDANIKDNQKYETERHAKIYFPNLRDELHQIFSGTSSLFEKYDPEHRLDKRLSSNYKAKMNEYKITQDTPIIVSFTKHGLVFEFVHVVSKEEKNEIEFDVFAWEESDQQLKILAYTLNDITMTCIRKIPELGSKPNFKNIHNIDTNPIYDQLVFTFALYNKLHMHTSMLKAYIQSIMFRKRTNYTSMCLAFQHKIVIPDKAIEYFDGEIIFEKFDYYRNEAGIMVPEDESHTVIKLLDYSGAKFNHNLQLSGSKRMEYDDSDRFINLGCDDSVSDKISKIRK